jgi:L-lysine 2,3-aminomutase
MDSLSEVLLQGINKKLDTLLSLIRELIKLLGKKINKDGL